MATSPLRPVLRPGDRVAVVSPASHAKPELVHAGCDHLRAYGYQPVIMPHALRRGPLYFAGSVEDRLSDLHAAFADESIRGIICTRGGWGSAELLPFLQRELIAANPKVFVGYSDHTSLHTWLWNECGLQTFYAPMVAADWSREDGVDTASWVSAVEHSSTNWTLGATDGLTALREGAATGKLLGGCLSILAEALGTPWALRIEGPSVLFLEDIGTKPYQWDRMIQHLHFAGLLNHVTGIVLGDMGANVPETEMPLLREACLHALSGFAGPVGIGLRCGHLDRANRSIVLGANVTLTCGAAAELAFQN